MAMSLFRRSFLLLAAAAVAAAVAFAGMAVFIMDRIYVETNARVLGETARALASGLPDAALDDDEAGYLAAAAWSAGAVADSELRLTLVRPDGRVIADTRADPRTMENHGARPEVRAALAGGLGSARRRSATIGRDLMYAALPVARGGATVAVLRLAIEVPSLATRLSPEIGRLLILTLIFIAAAAGAAAGFSRWLSLPLAHLAQTAREYGGEGQAGGAGTTDKATDKAAGAGRFRRRLGRDTAVPDEYRVLGGALDAMAAELARRIAGAEAQGKELEAILDAMTEAVIALDEHLRIRLANPTAIQLFGLARGSGAEPIKGRELLEALRSVDLNAIVADCLNAGSRRQAEIALYQGGERWFQAFATPLFLPTPASRQASAAGSGRGAEAASEASAPRAAGVVLVLNDITELRRLERVRKDFVANVSHELRTPIQLIKGFAETLQEESKAGDSGSAAADSVRAEAEAGGERRDRFLAIIERNAERMDNLIHDLLTLARLEQDGSEWLVFEDADICSTLVDAVDAVLPKAETKGIAIEIDCPPGLHTWANTGLLEQAVLNLVDNAVKYSPSGSEVRVEARVENAAYVDGQGRPAARQNLAICVRDRGSGIPAKDLPRIFERFYRVDKARSRELGGTGLGLAIVRHIALAHGGTASVESWEGEGSAFTIRIPLIEATEALESALRDTAPGSS